MCNYDEIIVVCENSKKLHTSTHPGGKTEARDSGKRK